MTMKFVSRLRRIIIRHYLMFTDPVKYAKKIGVNIKGKLHIYGNINWGSEPWIISIGDNVHLTEGVSFLTHDAGILIFKKEYPDLELTKPIVIGNNVYIGSHCQILGGVTIGNKVIIGCGTIITKDIPDNSVVVGVPGKVIKSADEYLEKAKKESINLGHLLGEEKDRALMKYYNYEGTSKGIYF